MPDARLVRALIRWQHSAGPYWPYVCAAPFLADLAMPIRPRCAPRASPARAPDSAVRAGGTLPADPSIGRLVGQLDAPGDSAGARAVLADLPIEMTLAMAPALSRHGWHVVPVVQRWATEPAILPSAGLLTLLLDGADHVARPSRPRGVILLADGERAGQSVRVPRPSGRAFDNRYAYQICRFPPASLLRSLDVRALSWVCPAGIARDLGPYAAGLSAAGVPIELVTSLDASTLPVHH